MIQPYGLAKLEIVGEQQMILLIHGKGKFISIFIHQGKGTYNFFVPLIYLSVNLSMTTIADLNDKWASYAGPGGWNGNVIESKALFLVAENLN